MGLSQSLSYAVTQLEASFNRNVQGWKRKRRFSSQSEDSEDELNSSLDRTLHTRRRKRLKTTSQYIYRALFQEGQNSDISVLALGKEWKLHKIYLCQSAYFHSMFSGAWRESNESVIHIEILDPNINLDALTVVFGSLYHDELSIEAAEVVSVLATATLLQLDGVIEQCVSIMEETVNLQTAVRYYEAANQYGVRKVKEACFRWLLVNLLSFLPELPKRLREISVELMTSLVASHDLVVLQTEFSLYVLLKLWVFLRLHPAFEGSPQEGVAAAHTYFQSRPISEPDFVLSEEGLEYEPIFRRLRHPALLSHPLDVEMLQADRILPANLLLPIFHLQWYAMLRSDQGLDKGPNQLSEADFYKHCNRLGRVLSSDGQHMWRWTGYNFGLDLVMTHERGGVIKMKRNQRMDHEGFLSVHHRRHLMYRLTVANFDEQRQVRYSQTTGVQSVTLCRNEEVRIMQLGNELSYPLLISANFLVTTPTLPMGNTSVTQSSAGLLTSEDGEPLLMSF